MCQARRYVQHIPDVVVKGAWSLLHVHGFQWVPTMRMSHDSWGDDKVKFNGLLEAKGYQWVVYVKLYVSGYARSGKAIVRPLVVGKSGSYLVNASGCDLSFSMAPEDGPARRFLLKNRLEWYHEKVLIKGFRDEKAAYRYESKIANKLNLFGS